MPHAKRLLLVCEAFIATAVVGSWRVNPVRAAEPAAAAQPADGEHWLAGVDCHALLGDDRAGAAGMLARNLHARLQAANVASTADWNALDSRDNWEKFRAVRLQSLRKSLGAWPEAPKSLEIHVTGTIAGDGYAIDKLLYQTRPGLWVSANLYRPLTDADNRPAILISHCHHNPKTQSELQTMGANWARQGALVLVPDQLGHGERRQHPFATDADFSQPFKQSRQDYYFRYDTALQLDLVGESLMGWMAWDLDRGLDVLLAQKNVDPKRTIILGAVAGGGDSAAVAAALDPRFAAAAIFNFGGPQPETRYPLPADAQASFNYAGSGSWESTRNLRRSAADGFLPWMIVGSLAPRGLIYGHEFTWDQPHDPVWKRLEQIYAWEEAPERLASSHGEGSVKGHPPEATHCNNIGPKQLSWIYPVLHRWFDMPEKPASEPSKPRPANELQCWSEEWIHRLHPQTVRDLAAKIAAQQVESRQMSLAALPPAKRRDALRQAWTGILGDTVPKDAKFHRKPTGEMPSDALRAQTIALDVEPGIQVTLVLLLPPGDKPVPLVLGLAQQGKERLLAERRPLVAALLAKGIAVGLVDVRGVGETAPEEHGRGRVSTASDFSSSEQMLGGTMLGERVRDFRAALHFLQKYRPIDPERIALWGDSLAEFNSPDQPLVTPHDAEHQPRLAEPLGGLAVLLTALFEDDLQSVYIRRGLTSYASTFKLPSVLLPHDTIVPGAMAAGDLPLLISNLAPTPIRMEELIDATNRPPALDDLDRFLSVATFSDRIAKKRASLVLADGADAGKAAAWLATQLGRK